MSNPPVQFACLGKLDLHLVGIIFEVSTFMEAEALGPLEVDPL